MPVSKSQTKPADCARQSMAAFCAGASMTMVLTAHWQIKTRRCAVGGELYRGNRAARYYSVPRSQAAWPT